MVNRIVILSGVQQSALSHKVPCGGLRA